MHLRAVGLDLLSFDLAGTALLLCASAVPAQRNRPKPDKFNSTAQLPFQLRLEDFAIAMQDVYDLFFDVNSGLLGKGLERLDDFLRPAIMSGLLSDLLTASIAKHARTLTQNRYFNGHPDLVVQGIYAADAVKAGTEGVEIKTTRKSGGAVDTHGARDQWMAVFVYDVDITTEPARDRRAMTFTEVYLAKWRSLISVETRAVNWEREPPRSTVKAS